MKTVGERIKEKRKALGFTQGDLSGSNLSRGMISLIERNQTTTSIRTIEHIAMKLGVPVSELLGENTSELRDNNIQIDANQLEKIISMCTALFKVGKYQQIIDILQKISLPKDLVSYNGPIKKLLGLIELQNQNYHKSAELLNESLPYTSPFDGDEYVSLYYYLSECYMESKNYHLGIGNALYGSILLKSKHLKDDVLLHLKILYNLAYCYCRISEYKKGLEIIYESFNLMKHSQVNFSQGSFYMLKGLAELYLKNYSDRKRPDDR